MISLPVLIAVGPCLMLGMAALALAVVNVGFSRTVHAMLWAGGCAAGAAQWGAMSLQGTLGASPLHSGPVVDVLAILSVTLLAEGFRVRRSGRAGRRVLVGTAAAAIAVLALLFAVPPLPVRAAVSPLLSLGLLGWAAATVVPPGTRPQPTEVVVVAVLLAVALVHLGGTVLALGEQAGMAGWHRAYVALYLVAAEPASAAVALGALLLIAFDYAVELRRLLHTDPLTGVLNRQGFDHAAAQALERGRPRRLVLAMADIDRFKQVNDTHGHAVGDATLAGFGAYLAERIGRDGVVARVGGEEFALLLPGLDAAAALELVEGTRLGMAQMRIGGPQGLPLSASFGVAERAPGEPLDRLVERADAALYRSKREGRGRSTLAGTA